MVAPVLAVLKVVASTSLARQEPQGDIRAKMAICPRYQTTWHDRPATTTTMNQSSDWNVLPKPSLPTFAPRRRNRERHERDHPEQHAHQELEPTLITFTTAR